MPYHDIVVIGASAGGLEALVKLVKRLPAQLPAAIFVVVHFPTNAPSTLPDILRRNSRLPAKHIEEGEAIQKGMIFVAPPNTHLILDMEKAHLNYGPKVNGFRPAIDPLFQSAARSFGPRTIGIILSGSLDDGTGGLQAIKQAGGIAIVQEPNEALVSSMPASAIENVSVDFVLPVAGIARQIARLSTKPLAGKGERSMEGIGDKDAQIVETDIQDFEAGNRLQQTTTLTCPECGGVIWEVTDGNVHKYRCHVGHVYSADSMMAEQTLALENALWAAMRVMRERGMLMRRMATIAHEHGNYHTEKHFLQNASEIEHNMEVIRNLLTGGTIARQHVPPSIMDGMEGPATTDE